MEIETDFYFPGSNSSFQLYIELGKRILNWKRENRDRFNRDGQTKIVKNKTKILVKKNFSKKSVTDNLFISAKIHLKDCS